MVYHYFNLYGEIPYMVIMIEISVSGHINFSVTGLVFKFLHTVYKQHNVSREKDKIMR